MFATVIESDSESLLVRDVRTGDEVRVFFRGSDRFMPGDRIIITYSGAMTRSIPPQITATSIQRIASVNPPMPQPQPTQTEFRGVVLQRRHNSLLVRDTMNGRQVIVNYPYAHHFCVSQQIDVKYDTITLSDPPRVDATDITPIC